MERFDIISNNPPQTQQLGKNIGRLTLPGDILLLVGNLGAGKTCLTQGIAYGLDIDEYISSPSFVLIREFSGRLPLYHIDLYRLDLPEEIATLGLDDYLYGSGVCVIEWAEKGLNLMPSDFMLIRINYLDDIKRSFELEAKGTHYNKMLKELKAEKTYVPSNRHLNR
ncbi:MAG: tRNA (adenosine(37)-N6)-threonylcarbamoyltransferase complex ATPase subunit type 1 TsaE [Dehalococcoidia bacterium]|nr:MAG: tRNA (adenosine(37)-N6)-threonylcarbamoyltransferase complex ATPase subunit type 1 TsaE [Dehalococcoidia bacterium]